MSNLVTYRISHSCLICAAAAEQRWHPSYMKVIERTWQEFVQYKISFNGGINGRNFDNPRPWHGCQWDMPHYVIVCYIVTKCWSQWGHDFIVSYCFRYLSYCLSAITESMVPLSHYAYGLRYVAFYCTMALVISCPNGSLCWYWDKIIGGLVQDCSISMKQWRYCSLALNHRKQWRYCSLALSHRNNFQMIALTPMKC